MLTQLVQTCDDQSRDFRRLKSFNYNLIKTYKVLVLKVCEGSIVVSLRCPSLESLEHLWNDYRSGDLDKLAERYLLTDEFKKKLNLETSYLATYIDEENYLNCKKALMGLPDTCSENPGKDLLHPSETTITEQKQQNTDVPEKNPGKDLLHPSETKTTEQKRQNTDVPEKNPGKDLLHPSETTITEQKQQNTDVPEKNPGKDLLHPSETKTTEQKRQNTDVPEKTPTAPDQAVEAVRLGEQGPSSVSESVSYPDATTVQHIVGYAVSSGGENEERHRTHPLTATEGREGLNAGIPEISPEKQSSEKQRPALAHLSGSPPGKKQRRDTVTFRVFNDNSVVVKLLRAEYNRRAQLRPLFWDSTMQLPLEKVYTRLKIVSRHRREC
ncbi:uncharacterized protein LOC114956955 [Acropora millepora]|uniref:uncharacterized protein LOC114956955 n=1 Tax=Acropora millepora TaxID=45264 RepID=UPI001CF48D7C|nr:uncharacterized protein LOC114956955 [Acropora millepora]